MLELSKLTGEKRYLEGAVRYGKLAETMFLTDSPLPRATSSLNHYEAITGGDDLMLALWKLAQEVGSR